MQEYVASTSRVDLNWPDLAVIWDEERPTEPTEDEGL